MQICWNDFPYCPPSPHNTRRLDEPGAVAPGFSSILEVVYGGWFLNIHDETVLLFLLFISYYFTKNEAPSSRWKHQTPTGYGPSAHFHCARS